MRAAQLEPEAIGFQSGGIAVEDNGLKALHKAVEEVFEKKDRTILTNFLRELRGIFESSNELADYVNKQRDKYGNTALHTCYSLYEQEVVKIEGIFEKTRDIFNSKQDQDDLSEQVGKAAAFTSIIKHHLIEAGLDPNIKNLYGQTAIDVCDRGKIMITRLEEVIAEQAQQTTQSTQHVARLENESKNEPKRRSMCAIL